MTTALTSVPPSGEAFGLEPVQTPEERQKQRTKEILKFRETKEGKALSDWLRTEFDRCKNLRTKVQNQWYVNLSVVFGRHWIEALADPNGISAQAKPSLRTQQAPKWRKRRTINRTRAIVRTECSKFQSTVPNIVAVPATAEDQDVRAAYAAEQTWTSYQETKRFRRQYNAAVWWMVVTGVGFLKTYWDPTAKVRLPDGEDQGDIAFRKVSPLNMFVPEPREWDIEDQPYVIEAYTRTLTWAQQTYAAELKGANIAASSTAQSFLLDEVFKTSGNDKLDSVVVKEFWLKPGASKQFPKGGFVVTVEDVIVDYQEGETYAHGEFPYTKLEHMFNDTFWADSPLVDIIPLNREYNEVRTSIGVAATRMGNPQIMVPKGSIQTSKYTNEPGSLIEFMPGLGAPQPAPMAQLPSYVENQLERILMDMEDLSGQHEISRGQAPQGISAGTALAYLGERDDNYLTPQYQGVEEAFERVAKQTLMLFQQYVDQKRKIRVIGLDGAFDTMLLAGSDIEHGTDVRVEPGSGVGQSQAAKQQQVMDLVGMGIIDGQQALKMLELGGPQKVLDLVNAAERKAQRENVRMKGLTEETIAEAEQPMIQEAVQSLGQMPPDALAMMGLVDEQSMMAAVAEMLPPVVDVHDFDLHEVHIETHNRFRMSQEFETLPDEVKAQFEKHVQWHHKMGGMVMQQQLMAQMPPELAGGGDPGSMPPGGPAGPPPGAPPTGPAGPPADAAPAAPAPVM